MPASPGPRKPTEPGLGSNRQPLHPRSEIPMPDADREQVLHWLKRVDDRMRAADEERAQERGRDLAWRSRVDERLDDHEEQIRGLRELQTIGREVRIEQREQARALSQLATDVREVIRSDAGDKVDLAKLEAKVSKAVQAQTVAMAQASGTEAGAQAGKDAGRRSARAWGTLAVILSLSAAFVEHCVPALAKALNQ